MATGPKGAAQPVTEEVAQLRIKLKYPDLKTFTEKFATLVSAQGAFLASRAPRPVGTRLRFELLLGDGKTRALAGEGVVSWIREPDPSQPSRSSGMAVRFTRLDAESQRVVDSIVALRRDRGGTEPELAAPRAGSEVEELVDGPEGDAILARGRKIARAITAGGVDELEAELGKK